MVLVCAEVGYGALGTGTAIRGAADEEESGIRGDGYCDAGAGDRGEHGDLLRSECAAAEELALRTSRAPGDNLRTGDGFTGFRRADRHRRTKMGTTARQRSVADRGGFGKHVRRELARGPASALRARRARFGALL